MRTVTELAIEEVEDNFLFGLGWSRDVFPGLNSLNRVFDEDRVTPDYVNVAHRSVWCYRHLQTNQALDM